MILTESEKDSLRKFMRVESPLTEFARSIKGEDASAKQDSIDADKKEDKPFDLLAGIDVDNLPSELVEKLKGANTQFATLQTENKKATELATKNEKLARDQQARADRNFEQLRKHNLVDTQGKPTVNVADNEENKQLEELTAQFIKDIPGIDPAVAKVHARIALTSQKTLEPALFKKIGAGLSPALETVGDMYAGRLFAEAQLPKNDPQGIFQIPEVESAVTESLKVLVSQGATVNPDTITNLRDMAYGKHILGMKPEEREKMQTQFSTGGSRFGTTGNFATLQKSSDGNKPKAANAETQAAMDATMASMKRGMNLQKK